MVTTTYQWALVLDGVREDVVYSDEDHVLLDAKTYKSMFPASTVRIEQRRVISETEFGRWENYLAQHAGRPYENVPDTAERSRR